jgi:hypothetical protein
MQREFYCYSKYNKKYLHMIKDETIDRTYDAYLYTECKKDFITVDVVARDPEHSKEYDRFNVYELNHEKKAKTKILSASSLMDNDNFFICDGYIYEKITT